MSTYIGIDAGKFGVKIVTQSGRVIFPTKIDYSQGSQAVAGDNSPVVAVTIGNKNFLFGGKSELSLNSINYQLSDAKVAVVYAAMKKAKVPTGDVVLGLAMPYERFYKFGVKDNTAIKEYANFYTRNLLGYNVTKVVVVPEGTSTFVSFVSNRNHLVPDGNYILLDIGGYSVERLFIYKQDNGVSLDKDRSRNSLELGIRYPLHKLQEAACGLLDAQIDNPKVFGDLLLKPTLFYNGIEYNVQQLKDVIMKEYAEQLYHFLTADLGALIGISTVIISGGGAIHLAPYIKETWCNHVVYDDIYATASMAYMKATKEMI